MPHDGAIAQAPFGQETLLVGVDVVGRDRFERHVPELCEQVAVDHAGVVGDRAALAHTDVGDVAEVLGGGVRERRSGGLVRLERAAPGVGEDRAEGVAGCSCRVVAGWATAPAGVRRAQPLLHLPSGREPELRVPLRSGLAVDEKDVSGHARHYGLRRAPSSAQSAVVHVAPATDPPRSHGGG